MAFGSVLAGSREIELSTADDKTVIIKGLLPRLALWIFGIPHVGTRVRARAIMSVIKPADKYIMDAGCGHGIHCLELAKKGKTVFGFDFDYKKISAARRMAHELGLQVNLIVKDITKPLDIHKRFDAVICSDVLEHIENDRAAANELTKIVAPGGKLIITAPTATELNAQYRENFGHYREYTVYGIEALFPGFKVIHYKTFLKSIGVFAWKLNRVTFNNKYLAMLLWWPLYALTYLDDILGKGNGMSQIVVLHKNG